MAKMFAPILAFTCNEIWLAMPHRAGDDARNILLNEMSKPYAEYALSADEMAKWDTVITVRGEVNSVLEAARADKRIGKALEAQVNLYAAGEAKAAIDAISGLKLADLFIVSRVSICDGTPDSANIVGESAVVNGLTIEVCEASGTKCPRCWMHSEEANADGLCPRCAAVMAQFPTEELEG